MAPGYGVAPCLDLTAFLAVWFKKITEAALAKHQMSEFMQQCENLTAWPVQCVDHDYRNLP